MNYLFIHQNMPGQWRHIVDHLARKGGHRIVVVGRRQVEGKKKRALAHAVPGVEYRSYSVNGKYENFGGEEPAAAFDNFVVHGRAAAAVMQRLKSEGFVPDVIAAHPGWGESLFAKDVFPSAPLLHYCEFYYRAHGGDYGYIGERTLQGEMNLRGRNAGLSLSLDAMDWGLSPTAWQKAQHPVDTHPRISVLHDGIDTDTVCPNPDARLELPTGRVLTAQDEVLTFVARNLEPQRGFDQFLFAAARVQQARPNAHVVIAGGEGVSYGKAPPDGRTWKVHALDLVRLDPLRTHFVGTLPFAEHVKLLQVSSVHAYLSIPFVLSWSMTEAMSAGCLLVGSNTAPVRELIRHGHNGLLVDFFDIDAIAATLSDALQRRAELLPLRQAARATILEGYDQRRHCVPRLEQLLNDMAQGRLPPRQAAIASVTDGSSALQPVPSDVR
jgi:glycosyltransferase involved in cell wall biosynthesis